MRPDAGRPSSDLPCPVRPGEALFAPSLRLAFGVLGAVWPWTLTPLTARVVLGWYALPASLIVGLAFDGRIGAERRSRPRAPRVRCDNLPYQMRWFRPI